MRRWFGSVTSVWHFGEVGAVRRVQGARSGTAKSVHPVHRSKEEHEAQELRLAGLRELVASGEYRLPADAVARRVMDRMFADGLDSRAAEQRQSTTRSAPLLWEE